MIKIINQLTEDNALPPKIEFTLPSLIDSEEELVKYCNAIKEELYFLLINYYQKITDEKDITN